MSCLRQLVKSETASRDARKSRRKECLERATVTSDDGEVQVVEKGRRLVRRQKREAKSSRKR